MIDFNTRLREGEINNIMIIDEFIRMGLFNPEEMSITRQKKRLSVSLDGKGRDEKVRIVAGERERVSGTGFMNKFKGLFTPHQ